MNDIIPFKDIDKNADFGGKANKLAEMYQAGFPVPDGLVVGYNVYQKVKVENGYSEDKVLNNQEIESLAFSAEIQNQLEESIEYLKSKGFNEYAVRSSGNMEDMQDSSFAGQYDSVLHVSGIDNLKKAIKECWISVNNPRVAKYCEEIGIDTKEIHLNVVIQGMIDADAAGVAFTVNPLTGNEKELVVESVAGVGEQLVQGSVTPDKIVYNPYDKKEIEVDLKQTSGFMSLDTYLPLFSLLQDVQQYYGEPLDIEWAFKDGKYYLLQARPMTKIYFDVDDNWTNADLKDGGISSTVTAPFMYSLYEYAFETSIPKYFKELHVYPKVPPKKWFNKFLGFAYWNMEAVKSGAKKVPGFVERKFDESLGITPEYSGTGYVTKFTPVSLFNGVRTLMAANKSLNKRLFACKDIINKSKAFFNEFHQTDLTKLSDKEFKNLYDETINNRYLMVEGGYFTIIYDNSNATSFFNEALEKYNTKAKEKIKYLNLVTGLTNLSHLNPVVDLWELSRAIKTNADAKKYFETSTSAQIVEALKTGALKFFADEITDYIDKYAHHSIRELDILVPHWGEQPHQVFDALKDLLSQPDKNHPKLMNDKQNRIFIEEHKKIKSGKLLKKLKMHRHILWWREEMRDYSTRMYYVVRLLALELARRLKQKELISEPDDVFFLTFNELSGFFSGKDIVTYPEKIKQNRLLYNSFRNFKKPNEIYGRRHFTKSKLKQSKNLKEYKGLACSPGSVEASVSVIKDIYEADKIVPGSILITKFTDPAWTPYFSKISGLITETGGILSHGAVVSREYGIPAVLAVTEITDILKTGDKIILDGDAGILMIKK